MKTAAVITVTELQQGWHDILLRVIRGEEFVLTRHERPVARLVPYDAPPTEEGSRQRERENA